MTNTTDLSKRHIRSFVLRQGRVSPAQQRACETLLPRFGIQYAAQPLDLTLAFGRIAPKILEIGFGMGDSTATIARNHPENDYLSLEVHTPGVGNLLKLVDAQHIANVRIIQHDAVEVLRCLPSCCPRMRLLTLDNSPFTVEDVAQLMGKLPLLRVHMTGRH